MPLNIANVFFSLAPCVNKSFVRVLSQSAVFI